MNIITMTFVKRYTMDYGRRDVHLTMAAIPEHEDEVIDYAETRGWEKVYNTVTEPVVHIAYEELAERDYKPLFD